MYICIYIFSLTWPDQLFTNIGSGTLPTQKLFREAVQVLNLLFHRHTNSFIRVFQKNCCKVFPRNRVNSGTVSNHAGNKAS